MPRFATSWEVHDTPYTAEDMERTRRWLERMLHQDQERLFQTEVRIDQRLEEGKAGTWVEVPKGAYTPGRPQGFPNGFEVAAPTDDLTDTAMRPHWINGATGQRLRPVGPTLARWTAGWVADAFMEGARLRGYTSKSDLDRMVSEADVDWYERESLRAFLDLADTTPRPPLYLYAESFSPPVVLARHKLYAPAAELRGVELGGELIERLPDHVVLPVWDLGKGQPFADALGRTWDRSVGEA